MLPYERVRLHCAVRVHFRHIQVIYEVDQSSATRGSVVTPCFLLQGFFQHRCTVKKEGGEIRTPKDVREGGIS